MSEETPRVKGFRDFMRRSGWAALAILFVVTGLGAGIYGFIQSTKEDNSSQNQSDKLVGTKLPGYTPVKSIPKLKIVDITKGDGKTAKNNSTITVHYVGALAKTGDIFDASYDSGQPAVFKLARGAVIDGFYQGLLGMQVGGERQIYIPAKYGYGAHPPPGSGIPPNADLVFDVILLVVN